MLDAISQQIEDNISLHNNVKTQLGGQIQGFVHALVQCLEQGKKVLICGNGGSAADSQHFAAELVVRFKKERKALPCIALTTDSSTLTACSNDYSFDQLFSRQVEALGQEGDLMIGISTSGNSANVIEAIEKAKENGLKTITLLGKDGGNLKGKSDIELIVPSDNTARIQEVHIMILHIVCDLFEKKMFGDEKQATDEADLYMHAACNGFLLIFTKMMQKMMHEMMHIASCTLCSGS